MALVDEYFIGGRTRDADFPLVRWAQGERRSFQQARGEHLPPEPPLQLGLCEPIPKTPRAADYHCLPQPVVSQRIYDVLAPLAMPWVELVPAVIDADGFRGLRYYLLHVLRPQEFEALDWDASELEADGDDIDGIDKLALDEKKLEAIPEDSRRLFVLAESTNIRLWHRSVVEAITATNPTGIRFWPAQGWGEDSQFK